MLLCCGRVVLTCVDLFLVLVLVLVSCRVVLCSVVLFHACVALVSVVVICHDLRSDLLLCLVLFLLCFVPCCVVLYCCFYVSMFVFHVCCVGVVVDVVLSCAMSCCDVFGYFVCRVVLCVR